MSKCWMERYKQTEVTSTRKRKKRITKRAKQKCNCQFDTAYYTEYLCSCNIYILRLQYRRLLMVEGVTNYVRVS